MCFSYEFVTEGEPTLVLTVRVPAFIPQWLASS